MTRPKSGRYTPPKRSAVVLTNTLSDADSDVEKERTVRRRLVATTGRCPCGAVLSLPDLSPGSVAIVAVEHEPGCPAIDEPSS